MATPPGKDPLAFLKGNEPIFKAVTSQNWKSTEVGEPANWPLQLKYAISSQLANPCPSFVVWGKTRTFLYNAAFASFFPDQEIFPGQVGIGIITFGNHWDRVSSAIEQAYQDRGTVLKGVGIGTQGRLEQRYLDISIGSLIELDGEICGAWGICQEKTFELVAGDILRTNQYYMRSLIGNAPMGICVLSTDPLSVEDVNPEFLRLLNLSHDDPNTLTVIKHLLGVNEQDAEAGRYLREISHIRQTEGGTKIGYIDVLASPYRNRAGQTIGMTIMVVDVNDRVEAHQELFQVNEELAAANEELATSNEELSTINQDLNLAQIRLGDSLQKLVEKEHQIRQMVANAPFPIALFVGREMKIIEANQSILDVWGKGNDVIGKNYAQVLPELEVQSVFEQLTTVYDTATPFHAHNQRIDLVIGGNLQTFYFNYSLTPLLDAAGKVYGVMNTAADITDLAMALRNVQQVEENFRNVILQAPVAMCLLEGPEHKVKIVNKAMLEIWGRHLEQVQNLPVFEALPDPSFQGLEEVMQDVYQTGMSYMATEQPVALMRYGKVDIVYQNFVFEPYRDAEGEIQGVLAISVDVTEMVNSRKKVEETYGRLNLVVEAAELGLFDFNMKTGHLECDERCRQFFGVDMEKEIDYHRDFVGGIHPEDVMNSLSVIATAMNPAGNGVYHDEYRLIRHNTNEVMWIRAVGKVYFDRENQPERFLGAVSDITQTKMAELQTIDAAERKSRLAAIVESSDDVIISKDLNGRIATWNPSAQRMFGYTADEAIGKHISLIIPEDRLSEEALIISRISKGEKVDHFDTVRKAKDGKELQLSITVSPIFGAEGKVIGASKIARDISEQQAAKQTTARYTERLEAINLVINAISREVDTNHILQRVTQLTIHLLGSDIGVFLAQEDTGVEIANYIAPISAIPQENIPAFAEKANGLMKDWKGRKVARWDDIEQLGITSFGAIESTSIKSLMAVPVVSSNEAHLGNLFFGHHRSGYFTKEHEDLLLSIVGHLSIGVDKAILYDKVLDLNRKKDEFISLASHELKTPLAGINGYIQILGRIVKGELPEKYLSKAGQQIKKITSLVNDLLDVSKIEAGKLKFDEDPFDLCALVANTLDMTKEIHRGYTINFISAQEECVVRGDSQRIEQVLHNLLSNAIKYSPGSNFIEMVLECREGHAVVGVRDFGIGIPKDKMGLLFSRFYRIEEHTANISGLGIGLYLSKEIITRHHGEFWVDSELGEGSTFWFSLPLAT